MDYFRKTKIDQFTQIINQYDVDVIGYAKYKLNIVCFKPSEAFDFLFKAKIKI